MLLFSGDSPTVAEDFARADPYVKNGLVMRWRVRLWVTVPGTWAALPTLPKGSVLAVSAHPAHEFSKRSQPQVRLLAGLGVTP